MSSRFRLLRENHMGKVVCEQHVLDASMDRMAFIFEKFDHVVVAFSGGKDSGLLLELLHLYYIKHAPSSRVSVYHIDFSRIIIP